LEIIYKFPTSNFVLSDIDVADSYRAL